MVVSVLFLVVIEDFPSQLPGRFNSLERGRVRGDFGWVQVLRSCPAAGQR